METCTNNYGRNWESYRYGHSEKDSEKYSGAASGDIMITAKINKLELSGSNTDSYTYSVHMKSRSDIKRK